MKIDAGSEKPIFVQIAEQIEDSVFTGVFQEEEKIPSTNEIAVLLNINPHTVLKGMNRLVEEGIIYKRRGLGMFVQAGAVEKIRTKRRDAFFQQYVASMIQEAEKLGMTKDQVIAMVERGYEDERN
ncbi:MAG: GntR family transcriptional regulator [Lachnospiraceae bacterium]|nr:GntR family transcriptional regulator [Candidatus Fimimorpha excrementavium]